MEVEEKDLRELLAEKREEFRAKYADVINDLCVKYDKDLGVGFFMLEAIARAKIHGEEPLYESNIEFDADELAKDYAEIERISLDIYAGE